MQLEIETQTQSRCGKTCPVCCRAKTTPLGTFWRGLLEHTIPSTQAEDGSVRVWQSDHLDRLRGECWTLNISESRNDAEECSLSQVIELSAAPKYYLSARAAVGILSRANKRGKRLNPELELTLTEIATEASSDRPSVAGVYGGGLSERSVALTLTTKTRLDSCTENFVVEPRTFNYKQHAALGPPGISQTLLARSHIATATHSGVRVLTPVECERLQGFPDGHTTILSDTQRYKTLGNSMAVPVIAWLGERMIRTK